eukprot:jgi/Chlat1/2092/Chrsp17S02688
MSRALQLGVVLVLLFMTMQSELRPPVHREAVYQQQDQLGDQQQQQQQQLVSRLTPPSAVLPHSKFAVAVAARAQKLDRLEARAKHCEGVKQELLTGLVEETVQLEAEVRALERQLASCGILVLSYLPPPQAMQPMNTSVNLTTTTMTAMPTTTTTPTDAQQAAKQQGRVQELFVDGVQSQEFDD